MVRRNIPWEELEALQTDLVRRVTNDPRESYLLLSEPQPTFTYGLSSHPGELLWTDPKTRGVAVHRAGRGGRWTYHGPGQVVAYPIAFLPTLGYPKRAIRKFLGDFAASIRFCLADLGIAASIGSCPFGVYAPTGKIASFGISVQRGVSSHGAALYIEPQSEYFSGIIPCGMRDPSISSVRECGVDLEWEAAANLLTDYIKRGFQASKN